MSGSCGPSFGIGSSDGGDEHRLEREDVYWGTRLACLEMARGGTIRFWDMYWKQAATARAVKDAGMRAIVGAPLIDGKDPDQAPRLLAKASRTIDEIVSEPVGGAHQNPAQAAALLDVALDRALSHVSAMEVDTRLEARYQKFRAMGQIGIESPA